MLLDASGTLAADDAFVDRVIAVAININNLAVFQMHFDAATAGAHVTCGGFDFVPVFGRCVDLRLNGGHVERLAKEWSLSHSPAQLVSLGQNFCAYCPATA
jgi:hypothetical protein